jgi:hypothetical protein
MVQSDSPDLLRMDLQAISLTAMGALVLMGLN